MSKETILTTSNGIVVYSVTADKSKTFAIYDSFNDKELIHLELAMPDFYRVERMVVESLVDAATQISLDKASS